MKCHQLLIIFSCAGSALAFASCSNSRKGDSPLNAAAALPAGYNFSQKGFKVLSSNFNKKSGTVSMLFGNEKAKQQAMDPGLHSPGSLRALVTWKAVPDSHWFGADIPGELISLETVTADSAQNGKTEIKYARYTGKELVLEKSVTGNEERTRFILAMQPAVMP